MEAINAGPVRLLSFDCRAEGSEPLFVHTASLFAEASAAAHEEAGRRTR